MLDDFIELNRNFVPISKGDYDAQVESFEMSTLFGSSSIICWDDLLRSQELSYWLQQERGKLMKLRI